MKEHIELDGIIFSYCSNGYYKNRHYGQLHRYIWEKHNECKIPEGYIIHHKNEDKEDNDPSNLVLMENGAHSRLHNLGNTYCLGHIFSDEHKQKLSEAHKGNTNRLGKHHTEAAKRKMSKAQKGNTNMLGKHHTEEAKLQMSITRKGRVASDETKAKMSAMRKGKKTGYKYELTEEMIIDIDNGLSRNKFAIKYGSAEPWRRHKSNI